MGNKLENQINRLNQHLDKIQDTIGYTFNNKMLLVQAFTKETFKDEYNALNDDKIEDNKLLTYIGRKYYDLAITLDELNMHAVIDSNGEYISDYTNDTLAERNQKINNECKNSDAIAITFLFTDMLIGSNESNEVRVIPKVMSDMFEAIVGAVAVDSNFDIKSVQIVSEKMSKIKDKLKMLDTIYKNLNGGKIKLL